MRQSLKFLDESFDSNDESNNLEGRGDAGESGAERWSYFSTRLSDERDMQIECFWNLIGLQFLKYVPERLFSIHWQFLLTPFIMHHLELFTDVFNDLSLERHRFHRAEK